MTINEHVEELRKIRSLPKLVNVLNESEYKYEVTIDNDYVTVYLVDERISVGLDIIPETEVVDLLQMLFKDNTTVEHV